MKPLQLLREVWPFLRGAASHLSPPDLANLIAVIRRARADGKITVEEWFNISEALLASFGIEVEWGATND